MVFITIKDNSYGLPAAPKHETSQGPLKGVESALKALLGSEMETWELLVGTKEKSVSPMRGY